VEPNFQGPLVADPPSVFDYISGAYGPSTARYGRGGSPPCGLRKKLTLLPQSIRYRSGSACGLRTGFARAPEKKSRPLLNSPTWTVGLPIRYPPSRGTESKDQLRLS